MFETQFGPQDGKTWEYLCQQAFKIKYEDSGYQEMVASPGDYGIEGFTMKTGKAFQCYCPDKNYMQSELYEKQRSKITKDLKKLKKYNRQISDRLGNVKVREWIFVTPKVNHNKLLEHARLQQKAVLGWDLPFLSDDFTVLIHDGDFYAQEFHMLQSVNGKRIIFSSGDEKLKSLSKEDSRHEYEVNINRKNKIIIGSNASDFDSKLCKRNEDVLRKWTEGESFIKNIEMKSPETYEGLVRVINQYESELAELSMLSDDSAKKLMLEIKENLFERIKEELPCMSPAEQRKISDYMVSIWIALCPLDFEYD